MSKTYDPKSVEVNIYKFWEESGFFNPDNLDGDPFSMMMPPPNVTGVLHLGHAMENTLMDIMARYQRMKGKKVLLLPGTDHAAVATQAKVEKILIEKGIKNPRKELGREKLLEEIKKFSEQSKSTILSQIRRMGTSCDWSRLAYTFDDKRSAAVNEVFIKMYKDQLIYRGYRVVNWSVKGQSTCSDDELEYTERPGKMYTFKYSPNFPIPIATTRPETKLGDTAVAVNPNDDRYKKYIGEIFVVENFADSGIDLKIRIIADDSVDMDFGTGAVGVTPAHSMVDFEMYEKQNSQGNPIGLIQVIGENGKMNEKSGIYSGLTIKEAREKIMASLIRSGLMEKEEDISQNISTSDRFGDIIEVLPMTQWFVAVNKKIPGKEKTLRELMKEAVATGLNNDSRQKIKITPQRFEKTYFNWIDNLRDWCISRQIWWGHRIPVWHCQNENCKKHFTSDTKIEKCPICGGKTEQDPDTLDTWFSSGLWTFSTLGWPDDTSDLKSFHPTSWMQMGNELLFFWMARMILMSAYVLDEIPFKNVYIHGMLRDEKGNKFSKSAGNNIDPIEVSQKYGTDALRLSLISGITPGQDSKFYEEKTESARNFVNKLWNISRFTLQDADIPKNMNLSKEDLLGLNKESLWIIGKLNETIENATKNINGYNFSLAEETIRSFIRDEFADWYLEFSKVEKNNRVLLYVLKDILRLLHPFAPFVTEKIWSETGSDRPLIIESWPEKIYPESDQELKNAIDTNSYAIEKIKQLIIAIRDLKAKRNIASSKNVTVQIASENETSRLIISDFDRHISKLAKIESIEFVQSEAIDKNSATKIVSGIGTVSLNFEGSIDTKKEREKTEKEIVNMEKFISSLRSRLKNKDFVSKAPRNVIELQKKTLEEKEIELSEIKKLLGTLE